MTGQVNTKLYSNTWQAKYLQSLGHLFVSSHAISFSLLNSCPLSQFLPRIYRRFFSLGLSLKCRSSVSSTHPSENMPLASVPIQLPLKVLREMESLRLRLREKLGERIIQARIYQKCFCLFVPLFYFYQQLRGESEWQVPNLLPADQQNIFK